MSDPDPALVERFHQALVSNDAASLGELLADDVEWHMSGRSRFAGSRDQYAWDEFWS